MLSAPRTGRVEEAALVDRLVVIGGSAGAIEALQGLVASLPRDLPAAILVAVHLPATADSALPQVLSRSGPLPARHPHEGDRLAEGEILVAPPDRHLQVRDDRIHLSRGPRQNGARPAIDALFPSAALSFGPRLLAVVLSGALDDGTVGAAVVAAQEGAVVVQDPAEARVSSMPRSVLTAVRRARPTPTARLGPAVAEWARSSPVGFALEPADDPADPPSAPERSSAMDGPATSTEVGVPAALGCPECQGGMFESVQDGTAAYACYVGHAWSGQSLLEAERQAVEAAIYNASSKLLEMATVHRRLAELDLSGDGRQRHLAGARAAEDRAERIRRLATDDPDPG